MYLKTNQQNRINKNTLILTMTMFYPAVHNYVWRVLVAVTGLVGLHFSIEVFDAIVWTLVIGYILATTRKLSVKPKTVLFYLLFVLIALLSFLFTEYEQFTVSTLLTLLFETISFFILGASVNVKNASYPQLYAAAVGTLIISMIYSLYSLNSAENTAEYNMDFAYRILPSVLVIVSRLFTDGKKKLAIVFSVLGIVFLLLQGTRGPLLCLAAYICLMLYKKSGLNKSLFAVGAAVLALALLISSPFVKLKLVDLSKAIDASGYSSRFITMMIEGELADSNGRAAIKETLLEDIREKPLALRGMFADREATVGLIDQEYGASHKDGTYAHSLWLELIYNWGIFFGGLLFLWICYTLFNFIRKGDREVAYIGMLFVCTGFVHLFMSGSYLQNEEFFFLIGLISQFLQAKKPLTGKDVMV